MQSGTHSTKARLLRRYRRLLLLLLHLPLLLLLEEREALEGQRPVGQFLQGKRHAGELLVVASVARLHGPRQHLDFRVDSRQRLLRRHRRAALALALAAALGEDPTTLETVVEPYLLQLGFLQRTPRGRMITAAGRDHLEAAA